VLIAVHETANIVPQVLRRCLFMPAAPFFLSQYTRSLRMRVDRVVLCVYAVLYSAHGSSLAMLWLSAAVLLVH
jgi:hypothetical protein